MKSLTIIVPVLNEQETIPVFYTTVEACCSQLPLTLEYLFVDDGSTDNTLSVI